MPKYRFAVKDEWGVRKTGVMEASTLEAARKRLLQGGFEVESVVDEGKALQLDVPEKAPAVLGRRPLYVSGVFVAFAFLIFLIHWLHRPDPPKPPEKIHFQLLGRVDGRSADPSSARLLIDFPELPLRLEYPWKEIATAERSFVVEVSFLAQQAPGYAWVRLSASKVPKALRLDPTTSNEFARKVEIKGHKVEIDDLQWKP